MSALLEVKGLKTYFATKYGEVRAVDDVSLSVAEGEVLGLVGIGLWQVGHGLLADGLGRCTWACDCRSVAVRRP